MSKNEIASSKMASSAYPTKDAKSYGYDAAEAALGSLPLVGAALQKLVQSLGLDPFARREQEYVQCLAEAVAELQRTKDIDVEALRENDYFEGLINEIRAKFRLARTAEKKVILIDIAKAAISGVSLNDALAGRFLALVDQFSAAHVQMLKVLQAPTANEQAMLRMANVSLGGLSTMLEAAMPTTLPPSAIPVVYNDLLREELVEGGVNVTMSSAGLMAKRTTNIGDAFLRFLEPRV